MQMKISTRTAIDLFSGISALDAQVDRVVKKNDDGAAPATVKEDRYKLDWGFKLALAKNKSALAPIVNAYNSLHTQLVAKCADAEGNLGPEAQSQLAEGRSKMMELEHEVVLVKFGTGLLNFEENNFSIDTLALLMPLIDESDKAPGKTKRTLRAV